MKLKPATFKGVCLAALCDAGWPPIGVFFLHALLPHFGFQREFDHFIHSLGGASIAYFFYRTIEIASHFLGLMTRPAHYLMAFTSSCTAALFWEFGEFASDQLCGTQIQSNISETLLDLIFGVMGALISLTLIYLWKEFSKLDRKPKPKS